MTPLLGDGRKEVGVGALVGLDTSNGKRMEKRKGGVLDRIGEVVIQGVKLTTKILVFGLR